MQASYYQVSPVHIHSCLHGSAAAYCMSHPGYWSLAEGHRPCHSLLPNSLHQPMDLSHYPFDSWELIAILEARRGSRLAAAALGSSAGVAAMRPWHAGAAMLWSPWARGPAGMPTGHWPELNSVQHNGCCCACPPPLQFLDTALPPHPGVKVHISSGGPHLYT